MSYAPAFDAQIPKTLAFEGGYVDDPSDPGGETNFGISKRSYPDLDIAGLTKSHAIDIYYNDYWSANGLDGMHPMSAGKLFDMCVNMGVNRASRILQTELNRGGFSLIVDGKAGPKTFAAALAADDAMLTSWLRLGAAAFYTELASDHPAMRKYLRGWLRRASA